MKTYSGILAWGIPWTAEPGGSSPWGRKESDMTEYCTQAHYMNIPQLLIFFSKTLAFFHFGTIMN